jgi:hypothetical protein
LQSRGFEEEVALLMLRRCEHYPRAQGREDRGGLYN